MSFKLGDVAAANGLLHASAHGALSDVRATIALARKLKDAQPRLFDFCFGLHRKERVTDAWGLPSSVQHARPFWHVSAMLGVARGCLALMWPVAMHPKNKNELLAWDLAHDPTELARLNATDLHLRLFTKVADLPEGLSRLLLKSIHLNRAPTPSYRCPRRGYFGCAGGLRQCHSSIRWLKPLPSAAPVLYGAPSRFSAVTFDPGVVAARMQG